MDVRKARVGSVHTCIERLKGVRTYDYSAGYAQRVPMCHSLMMVALSQFDDYDYYTAGRGASEAPPNNGYLGFFRLFAWLI